MTKVPTKNSLLPLDGQTLKQVAIQERIQSIRDNMQLLIDFAIGTKTLPGCTYKRTEVDDARLLISLKTLREKILALQHQKSHSRKQP